MSFRGPRRAEQSLYRKRKQLYLDGSVAGGLHGSAGPPPFHQDLPHSTTYDPIHPAYFWATPDYEPPAPWFEDASASAPPTRLLGSGSTSDFEPRAAPVKYKNSLMTPELMAEIMHELQYSGLEGLEPSEPTTNAPFSHIDDAVHDTEVAPLMSEAQSVEQAMSDLMAEPLDEVTAAETAFGEQTSQDLEGLVLEAMNQTEASQVQPDPFQEEQMMYEQQMQQMMDPYLMPGFGPGMMGPGFGPGP